MSACSQTDEPDNRDPLTPQVIFLFSPGGLGDMSYNDCILQGLQQFKKEHPDVDVFMYSPPDMDVTERIFSDWMKRPGSDIPVVFVLASSDFEGLIDRYIYDYDLTDNKRILLFETVRVYDDPRIRTFQVSMYGASYLAGATAAEACGEEGSSLILLGSSTDAPIRAARDGFADGFGSDRFDVEFLADDWTGFVMANQAYQKMDEWSKTYDFIFPVAGGSNTGIYRFTRDFADAPLLAGMDVDQSALSHKITGSVIKRLDLLVDEYLTEWLITGDMPESQIYGIESGYVDWQLSPRYDARFRPAVEESRKSAAMKEREYHGL